MDIDEKVSGPGGASQKNWSDISNSTDELPLEMRFNHGHMVSMIVYSVLMVVSATGNLTVLSQLVKRRRAGRASRLDLLLMHLAVADLMVTFLMMPLEIAWAGTVQWLAGDLMCRVMMFTRTFGLYLSSFVLTCIAVDRYHAILKPLNVTWEARVKRALLIAWVCAALASLPQSFIFHLDKHPYVKDFYQCVSYGSLPTPTHEFVYFIVNMILMYVIPLVSTLYCSTAALFEIIRRTNMKNDKMRRSGVGILGRARARTLKMTITIVVVFFACWSPYYCYCLWFWIDRTSLKNLDPAIQKAMWLFSCTNSCANPIVYGVFNRNRWSRHNIRCRAGSHRRGSRLPYGDSMEISAATLNRARSSLNGGRRDSAYNHHNGTHKHWNVINNNHVPSSNLVVNSHNASNNQLVNNRTASNNGLVNNHNGSNSQLVNNLITSNNRLVSNHTASNNRLVNNHTASNNCFVNNHTASNNHLIKNHIPNGNHVVNKHVASNNGIVNNHVDSSNYVVNSYNHVNTNNHVVSNGLV